MCLDHSACWFAFRIRCVVDLSSSTEAQSAAPPATHRIRKIDHPHQLLSFGEFLQQLPVKHVLVDARVLAAMLGADKCLYCRLPQSLKVGRFFMEASLMKIDLECPLCHATWRWSSTLENVRQGEGSTLQNLLDNVLGTLDAGSTHTQLEQIAGPAGILSMMPSHSSFYHTVCSSS
jgi:hypothetical protein